MKCTDLSYLALKYRGFEEENIHYLSAGTFDTPYANTEATNANLQQAIINCDQETESLIVYLTDHGGEGVFRMNSGELLSATELDSWLDELQENIPAEVTVIYDACNAGSFVQFLKPPPGKKRTVIASTSPGEPAHFISNGPKLSDSFKQFNFYYYKINML